MSKLRGSGQEELPCIQGQGRPGEATSHPRPGRVALRSNPRSSGCPGEEGLEELSHIEGKEGQQ